LADSHGRFIWYELMTTDMVAAKAFYAKVMGWGVHDLSTSGMAYALFTAGTAVVTGVTELPGDAQRMGATPRWQGYVGVDDVDAVAQRIRQLGGAVHTAPTDIPEMSRFAVVSDPQMATLAILKWLNPEQHQPPEPGKPGGVSWHELLAADREKAFAFYGELFGWQKADADAGPLGTYQVFSVAGQTIGGMFTKSPMVPVPFWLYYFGVTDIDAAAERVTAGGGRIVEGPLEVPGGSWIVRCTDPQDAVFALEGKRRHNAIGYFEGVASRDPAGAPRRRWSW